MKQIDYLPYWKLAMENGLLTGRPFSIYTIKQYHSYVQKFLEKYSELTLATLKSEFLGIPVDQFGRRDKFYKAITCFAKYLISEDVMNEDFLAKMKPLRPKRHRPPKQTTVDSSGIRLLMEHCQSITEQLLIVLLSETGLRANEACSLSVGDINLEKGFLTVQQAKWGKSRRVGLSSRTTTVIGRYLADRPGQNQAAPLLVNATGKQMDRHGLARRLRNIGKRAGITVTPHAMRRAFVTLNVNRGRPLVHLQIACGHSDIKTTRSYCQTTEDEVIEAMRSWA